MHRSFLIALWVSVAACAVACLSTPAPKETGDGGGGGGVCGARSDFTAKAFPDDATVELGIREVFADDLNGDGYVDLIATNAHVTDPQDTGIFILLGPHDGGGTMRYHAFVRTSVYPYGIAFRNVVGNACKDITIFGDAKNTQTGFVEVYENTGAPSMFDPVPIARDVEFDPNGNGRPVTVTYGDFSGEGHGNDIAIANLAALKLLLPGSDFVSGLQTAVPIGVGPEGPDAGWSSINGVYAYASLGSGLTTHDLVVVENNAMTWLENDGSGVFGNPNVVQNSGVFNALTVEQYDFDGKEPMDLFSGGGTGFGLYVLERTGNAVTVTVRGSNLANAGISSELSDAVIGDLGGGAQPEVVIIDSDESGGAATGQAILVDNVVDNGTDLGPSTSTALSFAAAGVNPLVGVFTDFNGDSAPEVWALSKAGNLVCIQRNAASRMLEECP